MVWLGRTGAVGGNTNTISSSDSISKEDTTLGWKHLPASQKDVWPCCKSLSHVTAQDQGQQAAKGLEGNPAADAGESLVH